MVLKKVPVQKLVYKELITRRFQSPLEDIFQKRISEAFHNYLLDLDSTIHLRQCFCTLRKVGCAAAVKVLKGWCNGWATSRRFQERVKLPCVFGCCNEQDDLHHYLTCPHLYAIWSFLVGGVSSDPLIRWGRVNPNAASMLQIVCVFAGCHAVRRHFKSKSEAFFHDQVILTGPQIRASWTVFADTYQVEAGSFL